jgi:alkylresorcinol/alkylpyrone synthase
MPDPSVSLQSLAAVVPEAAYRQEDLYAIFEASAASRRLRERSRLLMQKLLTRPNGIDTRHLAVPKLEEIFDLSAEELNQVFEAQATKLAARAVAEALARAQLTPSELDGLFICTCTGYLCPGLSSFVGEQLGMRANAYLHDLVGMGCGAAVPTWRAADAFARAHPGSRVAVVAVEVCSAAFYLDDDPGVLISASLFGDGAACALLGPADPAPPMLWTTDHFDTEHRPIDRELLRFTNRGGKLRNQLHRSVPERAAEAVHALYERFAAEEGADAAMVLAHPGGRDVVQALQKRLPTHPTLVESLWVLRHGGNLSSPSLLFALGSALSQTDFADRVSLPPSWAATRPPLATTPPAFWLTSFGAGFSAHSFRLQARRGLA